MKRALEDILFSGEDYLRTKNGIDTLYELFCYETKIVAGNSTFDNMKQTPNGMVVSPSQAANCLKDLSRTTHFLRGIHLAIEHYLKKKSTVHILYAGCGPYATLLTPFTSLYTSSQLRFTFIEIEAISFQAVKKLYSAWNITNYLEEIRLEDATSPQLQFPYLFDMVLSETMQAGLRNECQVPITKNLVRFLTKDGTFIPEKITLEVYTTEKPGNSRVLNHYVGPAYVLDHKNLPPQNHISTLLMNDAPHQYLQLFTEIHLFGKEKLTACQSGLTIPITIDRFTERKPDKVHFSYHEGMNPELKFEYEFN